MKNRIKVSLLLATMFAIPYLFAASALESEVVATYKLTDETFNLKLCNFFSDPLVYAALIGRSKPQAFAWCQHLPAPVVDSSEAEVSHYQQAVDTLRSQGKSIEEGGTINPAEYKDYYVNQFQKYNSVVKQAYEQTYAQRLQGIFAKHQILECVQEPGMLTVVFEEFPQYMVKIPTVLWPSKYQLTARCLVAKLAEQCIAANSMKYVEPVKKSLFKIPHDQHPNKAMELQEPFFQYATFYPIKRRIQQWFDALNRGEVCDANFVLVVERKGFERPTNCQISRFGHHEVLRAELKILIGHCNLWDIVPGNFLFSSEGKAALNNLQLAGINNDVRTEERDKILLQYLVDAIVHKKPFPVTWPDEAGYPNYGPGAIKEFDELFN